MSKKPLNLGYLNEDDRAYGLAGMAISLAAMDAMDMVSSLTLDSEDEPMVTFSHSYYFSAGPSISPKAAWHSLIQAFKVTTAMVVSNVLARSYVRLHEEPDRERLELLRRHVIDEGRRECELEEDESDRIFVNAVTNYRRLYRNPRIAPAVDELVRVISRRRSLSGMEVLDELRLLQLI